ncbi:TPM domain-containing protein [Asticcacaulis solisilvae]|uniref:TPM domain-containing protein n=1 Tax=Asticcacaulis solisilvae TaxID=1217274 RepID=UPI003FD89B92
MKTACLAVLAAAFVSAPAWAAPDAYPPLTGDVVDDAHVLSPATRQILTDDLANLRHATGHRLVVVTVGSLHGQDIQAYGIGLFRAWKVGRKGYDDGTLLIIAPADHKDRIEVGYGLEGVLTDAASGIILRDTVRPYLKAGDIDGAALAGERAIAARITPPGAPAAKPVPPPMPDAPWWVWLIFLGMAGMVAGFGALVFIAVRAAFRSAAQAHRTAFEKAASRQVHEAAEAAIRQARAAAETAQAARAMAAGMTAGMPKPPPSKSFQQSYDEARAWVEEMKNRPGTVYRRGPMQDTAEPVEPFAAAAATAAAAEAVAPDPAEPAQPAWEPPAAGIPDTAPAPASDPAPAPSPPEDDSRNYTGGSAGGGGASDSW